jgi:hypothetical protein
MYASAEDRLSTAPQFRNAASSRSSSGILGRDQPLEDNAAGAGDGE